MKSIPTVASAYIEEAAIEWSRMSAKLSPEVDLRTNI